MAQERKDIEARYKWDLSVIYASETEFYEDYAKAEKAIEAFSKYQEIMCNSAKDLYNTLKSMTDIEALIEKLFHYASLNFSVETSNNAFQSLNAKVRNLAISAGTATWFVEPYVLRIPEETIKEWLSQEGFRPMEQAIPRHLPPTAPCKAWPCPWCCIPPLFSPPLPPF